MEKHYQNPSPAHSSPSLRPQKPSPWHPVVRFTINLIVLGMLAIGAYTLYIAIHEPDRQETVVLGQTRFAAGSPAAMRVLVRDRSSGRPVQGARVELSLHNASTTIWLGSFRTDATGTVADSIAIPDIASGQYELVLDTHSALGSDRITKQLEVQQPARLFLSSDKPIYQPGQTLHLRSLTLNERTQKPFANEELTFEVLDPKGNKVFKETRKTSEFGIAAADFVLASELNLGRYEIRASSGTAAAARAVEVKRYVLPKFKINLATDKSYYLPGQTVTGSIQAGYFFGRPVSGGTVRLTATTLHEKPVVITELQGRTDDHGKYEFQFSLPDVLVGMPQMNERAFLDLTAQLRDAAQHLEETTLSLSVARNELELTAIPETAAPVPGVENFLYLLTAYPDGRPAVCRVFLNGTAYQSDVQGVTQLRLEPQEVGRPLDFQALDAAGRRATLAYRPDSGKPASALLLRTDKAVYQAGDEAQITVLSSESQNTVFIDILKDGQTVLTKSVPLENHRAEHSVPLPPGLTGVLKLNAYLIDQNGEDRGCSRIIYVNPASGLRVATTLSKTVFRPGEVAKLDFLVTDPEGRPAPAALGLAVVDESVFAVQGSRPGLLQQFLEAEGDLLKPRYEIESFACPLQIFSGAAEKQSLAQAYLASLEEPQPAGPTLDDLISQGLVSRPLLEHARQLRGTPAYERYRRDPRYGELIRLLEGGHGLYTLREATGPVKLRAVEAQRKAYFDKVDRALVIGFWIVIVGLPLGLLLYAADKRGRVTVVEVLLLLSILALLAAMLLPALAKAKARAMSVSLLSDLKQLEFANQEAREDRIKPGTVAPTSPRVRRDLPETLLWRPELLTDGQGRASLEIPLADSITTWRASIDGISAAGSMGSTEVPITVFQDFFVDLDLPVSMSLGDQVAVPLACYNYLKEPQDVRLTVAKAAWFESSGQNLRLHLEPNEVKSVSFPLKVVRVGNHSLRLTAQGARLADAVERQVRVLPTGEAIEHTRNGVLKENWSDTFSLASDAIPDSQSLRVKFYPSRFTEIVEGLDSIFQAPYGCFEQTSSTTYPNVLALDYLKRIGRLTPEVESKARMFINAGYQRLLTFEVPGGGFEWFGRSPAHVGLTAYGVLEFTDMSRIHPVDPAMVARTRDWLFARQNSDGSWEQGAGLHGWSAGAAITSYVAWALAEAGDHSPNLDKALEYLRAHPERLSSTYQKALAANAFLTRAQNDSFGVELARNLKQAALADAQKTLHWTSQGQSITYSDGPGMEVETTALCSIALMKAGLWPESVKQALTWLSRQKTHDGTWGSTQATILAMRALLAGSTASLGQETDSTITVLLNGKPIETFHLNRANTDVMKEVELTDRLVAGENRLELRSVPAGELPFQVAGVYWRPAVSDPLQPANTPLVVADPLQIQLDYDRTTLPVNEQLGCDVTVKNRSGRLINMAMVDLGIPPGFVVDPAAFEVLQNEGQIAKFELTGNQAILYLRELSNLNPFRFKYSLRARYPLRVQTLPSAVYEYYQPNNRALSKPVVLQAVGG